MEKRGIDISYAQTSVDWAKVKAAGVEFAMVRAGYGRELSQKDSMFESHYAGAKSVGIPVGTYWYSYAKDVDGAKKEAAACLETIRGKSFEYPVAFDIEDPSQRDLGKDVITDIAVAFLEEIEKAGYFATLYSSLDWLRNRLDYDRIKRFDIWLAQWRDAGATYEHPYGMWQYTSSGSVDGIAGRVDRDIAYKDYVAIIREAGLNGTSATPAAPSYPEPTRNIVNYTTGDDVKWVQEKLQGLGYSLGSYGIDGKYGNTCESSVKQLQRDYGLSVDGIVGPDTRKALKGQIVKAVNPYRKPTQNIYLGDWGDGIRWVQYELKRRGYNIGSTGIDGKYGTSTKAAVERFQRASGLTVDGIVGPKTREALAA
ncbi:MAG TPA: peptidoglycan-binding protein [Candidatus Onthovicinus excrementipullorum]|nr:peptidoglycan-binding protein [Candidatus Onthovicinus excrementipullorum]